MCRPDVLHYLYAHLRRGCREHLLAELGDISYADYLQLGCKSAQAQEFFCCAAHYRGAHQRRSAAIAPIVLALFRLKSNCPSALTDAKPPAIMMMDGPPASAWSIPGFATRQGSAGHPLQHACRDPKARRRSRHRIDIVRWPPVCPSDYALPAVNPSDAARAGQISSCRRYLLSSHSSTLLALEASNGIQCFLRDFLRRPVRPGVSLRICKPVVAGLRSAGRRFLKTSACRNEPATFCQ